MHATRNLEKNGIEVRFPQRPPKVVTERLRALGFKWHGRKQMWYIKPFSPELWGRVQWECQSYRDDVLPALGVD